MFKCHEIPLCGGKKDLLNLEKFLKFSTFFASASLLYAPHPQS